MGMKRPFELFCSFWQGDARRQGVIPNLLEPEMQTPSGQPAGALRLYILGLGDINTELINLS